jgi:hypothetical protein
MRRREVQRGDEAQEVQAATRPMGRDAHSAHGQSQPFPGRPGGRCRRTRRQEQAETWSSAGENRRPTGPERRPWRSRGGGNCLGDTGPFVVYHDRGLTY